MDFFRERSLFLMVFSFGCVIATDSFRFWVKVHHMGPILRTAFGDSMDFIEEGPWVSVVFYGFPWFSS